MCTFFSAVHFIIVSNVFMYKALSFSAPKSIYLANCPKKFHFISVSYTLSCLFAANSRNVHYPSSGICRISARSSINVERIQTHTHIHKVHD